MCVRRGDRFCLRFYDFSIRFWNCSTVWYFLFFLLIFLYDRLRNTIKYSNKIDYTLYTHPLHHPNVNLEYNDAFFSGLVFCNQKYLQVKT